jgi:hypothetical protein
MLLEIEIKERKQISPIPPMGQVSIVEVIINSKDSKETSEIYGFTYEFDVYSNIYDSRESLAFCRRNILDMVAKYISKHIKNVTLEIAHYTESYYNSIQYGIANEFAAFEHSFRGVDFGFNEKITIGTTAKFDSMLSLLNNPFIYTKHKNSLPFVVCKYINEEKMKNDYPELFLYEI